MASQSENIHTTQTIAVTYDISNYFSLPFRKMGNL